MQQQWGRLELPEGSSVHIRHTQGSAIGRLGASIFEDGWRRDESSSAEEETRQDLEQEQPAVAGSPETRLWLEVGEEVSLAMGRNYRRYLAFQVREEEALTLGVIVDDSEHPLEVCLRELGSSDEVCREGVSESLFERMSLPAGDYALALRRSGRSDEAVMYIVSLKEAAPVRTGGSPVPTMPANGRCRWSPMSRFVGTSKASGEAWFALQVSGESPAVGYYRRE